MIKNSKMKTKTRRRNAVITISTKFEDGASATRLGRLWKQIVERGLTAIRNDKEDPETRQLATSMTASAPKVSIPD